MITYYHQNPHTFALYLLPGVLNLTESFQKESCLY